MDTIHHKSNKALIHATDSQKAAGDSACGGSIMGKADGMQTAGGRGAGEYLLVGTGFLGATGILWN